MQYNDFFPNHKARLTESPLRHHTSHHMHYKPSSYKVRYSYCGTRRLGMQTATATAAAAAVTTSRGRSRRCTINFDSFIIFHEIGYLKDIFFVKTFLHVGRWSILPLDLDHQLPSSVSEFSFLLSRKSLEELQDVTNEEIGRASCRERV